jgi:G3E family GTPase
MLELFPSSTAGPFGRPLKRERGARIPVTVVTGILGAGKTTLVRHFLSTPEGAGTAVIVNEFGETGIDDALLRNSSDNIALLGNGCLCCNVRSDLQVTLHRLVADRERSIIPYFQRIVIETSGLADPSPILTTFATDRALGGEFYVEAVITVIAAQSGVETIAAFAEARRQVILADRIVISKSDIADDETPAVLAARLRALNARATSSKRCKSLSIRNGFSPKDRPRSRASSPKRPATPTASRASPSPRPDRSPGAHSPAPWRR